MWAAVIWRLDWSCRIENPPRWESSSYLPRWLTPIAGILLLAISRSLGSSPFRPLHRLLECPYNMVADFPQNKQSERPRWKPQYLLWPSLTSHIYTSAIIYWPHRSSLFHGARRRHKIMTTMRISGGHHGSFMEKMFCKGRALARRHVGIDALMVLKLVGYWGNLLTR